MMIQKTFAYYAVLAMVALCLQSCLLHKKEISYITESYYNVERMEGTDSLRIQSLSVRTNDEADYLFKESKFFDFRSGKKTFYRHSNMKYEDFLKAQDPIIDPIFNAKIVNNDTLNSFYLEFQYGKEDTLRETYTLYSININQSGNSTRDSMTLNTTVNSKSDNENSRHFKMDSISAANYITWTKAALKSNGPLPFPKTITERHQLEFIKSTTHNLYYTNKDSTSYRVEKVDSTLVGGRLEITVNPIFNTHERVLNADGGFNIINTINSQLFYKETRKNSHSRFSHYELQYSLHPITLDTISKYSFISKQTASGTHGTYTIEDDYSKNPSLRSRQGITYPSFSQCILEIFVDSNCNYNYEAIVVSENLDTFLLQVEDKLDYSQAVEKLYKNGTLLHRPGYGHTYGVGKNYTDYMQASTYLHIIRSKVSILNQVALSLYSMKNGQRSVQTPSKKLTRKTKRRAKKNNRRKYRTYFFCIWPRYRICVMKPSFKNMWKRIKNVQLISLKSKPPQFAKDTKLMERNRREGYEKRIKKHSYDDDYVIYEIYYKKKNEVNKLTPIESF